MTGNVMKIRPLDRYSAPAPEDRITKSRSRSNTTKSGPSGVRPKFIGPSPTRRLLSSDDDTEPPTSSDSSTSQRGIHNRRPVGKPPLVLSTIQAVLEQSSDSLQHSRRETKTEKLLTPRSTARRKKKKSNKQRSSSSSTSKPRSSSSSTSRSGRESSVSSISTSKSPPPKINRKAGGMSNYHLPFAQTSQSELGPDMTVLADGVNLDSNTRTMLAYYDARSIEDFALMADADFYDLVAMARSMNRALPPLQIRKVEVLREWVKELTQVQHEPLDEIEDVSTLARMAKQRLMQANEKVSSSHSLPRDWKMRFKKELPRLRMNLKAKGDNLSSMYPFAMYIRSMKSLLACGYPAM